MAIRTSSSLTPVLLALVIILPASAQRTSDATERTLVQVDGGSVRGRAVNDVLSFKGIPFAQPPVGSLRWRPPQPVDSWSGVLDAKDFRSNCAQPRIDGTSEDCLYLNVWRPAAAGEKPYPVMVWIYGGGLVRGGGSLYPGEFLARQGIVVVSFNYRLGRLGFFAHPALAREEPDAPRGNYGYMDQLAALKWVQQNIGAFGGDPKNVTIVGESAGAGSVLVMLTSPMSRDLFQRAILQSPGIPTSRAAALPLRDLADAESIAVEYARAEGIEGDDDKNALEALRALPAATLVDGTDHYLAAVFGGPDIPGLAHSIIDGKLIVEPPEVTLRAAQQAMVPVIVGANDFDLASSTARDKDELFAIFGPLAWQARALYDASGDAKLEDIIQAAIADRNMVEPARNLAELMTSAGQPAYFYRFSYVPEARRVEVAGATHASEIAFVFDAAAWLLRDNATAADIEMGHTMSSYWIAFVKTGNPNGEGRPEWLPFNPHVRNVLNFTNTGVKFGPDPLRARLDLWRSVWAQVRTN